MLELVWARAHSEYRNGASRRQSPRAQRWDFTRASERKLAYACSDRFGSCWRGPGSPLNATMEPVARLPMRVLVHTRVFEFARTRGRPR